MAEEKKFLGTAAVEQLIIRTRQEFAAADETTLADAKKHAEDLGVNYDAAGTAATKVQELADTTVAANTKAIQDLQKASADSNSDISSLSGSVDRLEQLTNSNLRRITTNEGAIGLMDNLETTAKSDLVSALNEVRNAVSAGGTAAAITMTEQTSDLAEGVAKAYVLKQGENTVGTINIPKDMVVQSGEVVTDPEGQAAGTYIKLVLANATNDIIYVNVGTLVDIYKAKTSAAQVQIAINSANREISATIVAGSITATELAADAVTTIKIADGNVTKAKLSAEVQASLDKADVAETNAKSHADGLNTAMNTRVEALEAIDHDHANKTELDLIATGDVAKWNAAETNAKSHADSLNTAMNTRVEALEAVDHDHTNKTQLATYDKTQAELLAAAKSEAEGLVNAALTDAAELVSLQSNRIDDLEESLAEGGTTANAIADAKKAGTDAQGAVDALNTRVDALESVTYVEITATEIDAMFDAE